MTIELKKKRTNKIKKKIKTSWNGKWYFKACCCTTTRKKVKLIISNRDKYSISAMCKFLGITRSLIYYHLNKEESKTNLETEELLEEKIKEIFRKSKNAYGSRKIKIELEKQDIIASRRKICRIMKKHALVSSYTVKQYKVEKNKCNNKKIANKVDRNFDDRLSLETCVSDLTYVRVGNNWIYICAIIDLHNREIMGYASEIIRVLI